MLLYFCLQCLLESATLTAVEVLVQHHNEDLKGHGVKCAFSSSKCPSGSGQIVGINVTFFFFFLEASFGEWTA